MQLLRYGRLASFAFTRVEGCLNGENSNKFLTSTIQKFMPIFASKFINTINVRFNANNTDVITRNEKFTFKPVDNFFVNCYCTCFFNYCHDHQ